MLAHYKYLRTLIEPTIIDLQWISPGFKICATGYPTLQNPRSATLLHVVTSITSYSACICISNRAQCNGVNCMHTQVAMRNYYCNIYSTGEACVPIAYMNNYYTTFDCFR